MNFRSRMWIVFAVLLILFSGCTFPEHPEPDLQEYPTYFDNLASDILFMQGDSVCLIEKQSQSRTILDIPNIQKEIRRVQWASDGESFYFIDSDWWAYPPMESHVYNYELNSGTINQSDFLCNSYYLSPEDGSMIYSNTGGVYYFENTNGVSYSIDEVLNRYFENDSSSIANTNSYNNISWLSSSVFTLETRLRIVSHDSSIYSPTYGTTLHYTDNRVSVVDTVLLTFPRVTYSSDGSFGLYRQGASSEHDAGTFLINFAAGDTVQISDKWSFHVDFTEDNRFLVYSIYTVYLEMIDASTKYWVYDIETGDTYDIFPEAYEVLDVSLSPDGKQIICTADFWGDDYFRNIWVLNFDGSEATILSDPNISNNRTPLFKPLVSDS